MRITDELRKYAKCRMREVEIQLEDIADRIDRDHKAAVDKAHADGERNGLQQARSASQDWQRGFDAGRKESGGVNPVDADGVPIRFGDKIMVTWEEGKVFEVAGFSYSKPLAGGEIIIWVDVYSPEKKANIPLCAAYSCHHYHAPTVEDVLSEMLNKALPGDFIQDFIHRSEVIEAMVAEYATKLQLKKADD